MRFDRFTQYVSGLVDTLDAMSLQSGQELNSKTIDI